MMRNEGGRLPCLVDGCELRRDRVRAKCLHARLRSKLFERPGSLSESVRIWLERSLRRCRLESERRWQSGSRRSLSRVAQGAFSPLVGVGVGEEREDSSTGLES